MLDSSWLQIMERMGVGFQLARDLKGPWRHICERAQLENLRIHDLRHSFAAVGAGLGLSLPMIGKLLGHSQAQTTARYAHLAADPMHEAADLIGERLSGLLAGRG
jgi:integrase